MKPELPRSPAVERNRDAILAILLEEFRDRSRVLEIGSGTGEHAVHFARGLNRLIWQTSDRAQYHDGIRAWLAEVGVDNIAEPLHLDVNDPPPLEDTYDAVFSANTAHIMSFAEVGKMFSLVADTLDRGGRFCLYGPFNEGGEFTSVSNAQFDESLKAQNPAMGIRDLEALDDLGADVGLTRERIHTMPANNFLTTWDRV